MWLRPDQRKKLAEIQRTAGIPVSVSIRKAVDAYLKEAKKDEAGSRG
jgi:hypothetical protein